MEKLLVKEVVAPILIVIIAWLIYKIVIKAINRVFKIRNKRVQNKRYETIHALIKNVIKYFIIIVVVVMVLDVYGIDTKSIITSLGIVGVVSGLALQDFLKDFVAGITIIGENQFGIGDVISIGEFKGTVSGFTLKTTRIKAWTGEEKIIGNHLITEVINYTHNNSLALVDVGVSYDADLEKVEKVLNQVCESLKETIKGLKGDVAVLGIENLADSAIVYRVSAEVKAGEQFGAQRQIRKKIKEEFDKNNIEIPFNQLVIHNG